MNAVLQGKITRGLCVCCAGPDMELIEGKFLPISFFCFLFIVDTVRKVVKLSEKCVYFRS